MKASGRLVLKGVLAALVLTVAIAQIARQAEAASQARADAPLFHVDPFWHEPLDFPFILGSVNGVAVDSRNHVFIVHGGLATLIGRTEAGSAPNSPAPSDCCTPAPPVIEFDDNGRIVRQWGGEGTGYTWPTSVAGIAVDPQGNVWIGGTGEGDSHILKFNAQGVLVRQFGQPGQAANPTSTNSFSGPAGFAFDAQASETFVADSGNARVAVIDMNTGAIKRFWGAYGNAPVAGGSGAYNPSAPASQQFGTVTCVERSNDGRIYVCDRSNNRVQVFNSDGTFASEKVIAPQTLGPGSVWDVAFSADPQQRFLYVADGHNHIVHILDRATLNVVTTLGQGGRYPGQFYGVRSVATDSEGNLFTGETYHGKRVQKFDFQRVGPAPPGGQGAAWPM